jgi:hypothetical protein
MAKKISQEKFDELLAEILDEDKASNLLSIPGVYEVLSEHFNNDVLKKWNDEQEAIEDALDDFNYVGSKHHY